MPRSSVLGASATSSSGGTRSIKRRDAQRVGQSTDAGAGHRQAKLARVVRNTVTYAVDAATISRLAIGE
jgi:hypothetical protein